MAEDGRVGIALGFPDPSLHGEHLQSHPWLAGPALRYEATCASPRLCDGRAASKMHESKVRARGEVGIALFDVHVPWSGGAPTSPALGDLT